MRVISGGTNSFSDIITGGQHSSVVDYFKNNLMNYAKNTVSNIANSTNNFIGDIATSLYNRYSSMSAINAGKDLLASSETYSREDIIHKVTYDNIDDMSIMMQRYTMANPTIMKEYRRNTIEGYPYFIDDEPNVKPIDRVDYINSINDMMIHQEGKDIYCYNCSSTEITKEDELTLDQKINILNTWDIVNDRLKNDEDPTDIE